MMDFKTFAQIYRDEDGYLKRIGESVSSYLTWRHFKMLVFFFDHRDDFLKSAKELEMEEEYRAFLKEFPELDDKSPSGKEDEKTSHEDVFDPDLQEIY